MGKKDTLVPYRHSPCDSWNIGLLLISFFHKRVQRRSRVRLDAHSSSHLVHHTTWYPRHWLGCRLDLEYGYREPDYTTWPAPLPPHKLPQRLYIIRQLLHPFLRPIPILNRLRSRQTISIHELDLLHNRLIFQPILHILYKGNKTGESGNWKR